MNTTDFLERLRDTPQNITFKETMTMLETNYSFTPTAFRNGETYNEIEQNSGSCKVFSFAKIEGLTKEQTLHCFGDYYRLEVLMDPQGTNHQNIRNFMQFGWDGVFFEGTALSPRTV